MITEAKLLEKTFLRPDEAALVLSCSRRTIYRMIEAGALRSIRLGGSDRGGMRIIAASIRTLMEDSEAL